MSQKSRNIRYLILLLILLFVAGNEARIKLKVAGWDETLEVRVFAINGDASGTSGLYIDQLKLVDYKPIETFVNKEARRYGVTLDAVRVSFGGELYEMPPQPPLNGSVLENIFWSLRFRAWAWYWETTADSADADINLFVNYFDPASTQALAHSVGLQGGLIGLINAFAEKSYRGSNNVVIAHELMHTFGATDKYGAGSLPRHPDGYAEPFRDPLYPQTKAEIMGGRIPINATQSKIPNSLTEVVVHVYTASEIQWPVQ